MCLLRNERYKTYQTGFSFRCLGHAPGCRTCGYRGVGESKKFLFPKFIQIWCVSYLLQWHMQRHDFFGPHPLGPWGGAKRSNIIKSQSQSQFRRFLNQTFCVFSQMKDIKHVGRDFHSVAWVMPQGGRTCGYRGGWGVKKFFSKVNQIWRVSYLHQWHMQRHNFFGPQSLGPWGGAKRSNTIKSQS